MNNHLDQQRSCPFSITLVSDGIDDADNFMNEKKLSSITTSIPRQKKEQSLQPSDMDVSLERHHMKLEQPLSSQSIAPYPSTYDIIDLCTPVKSSSSCASSSTCMKTKEYVPRTIGTHNQARLSILPAFPTPIYNDHSHLLLANVPIQFLSIEQLYRRERQQQQLFNPQSPCTLIIHNHSTPSSIRNYFEVYYQPLIDRLNVDWTILDFNYTRLDHCLKLFANERIHRLRQTPYEVRLLEEEKSVAMEFFLQIDVDIFYMKTFSDRNIQPTAKNKGLFCTIEPEHRFIMKPCGQQNCSVCSLSNHITRRSKSSVNFEQNGTYRFLNGYETILNAPVMCNTNGIIYVLKCPCGKYEYVGETSNNLHYTLDRHRINGNRIMHYFLIGEPKRRENKNNVPMDQHSYEITRKNGMHLYQHSARCPTVMQMFLNCYPHYWIFVPMSSRTSSLQQLQQNTNYHQFATIAMTAATRSTVAPRSDHEIRQCLQDVPLSPRGFQFSEQQRDAQTEFFKYKKDLQLPNLPLDLYDASIIAVLPEKSSPVLRQFIVSLFITHGETKLNSIGNLLADNNTNPPFLYGSFRGEWCHSLTNRPTLLSLSSSLTTTTTTTTIIRTTAEPRACSATER